MKIDKIFSVPINESTARQRVSAYFEQAGYKPAEGSALIFKRGSGKGSWFSLNPSNLLTIADVKIISKGDHVDVRADFDIKTVVRDESHFTDEFWDGEIKDLETALFKGEYSPIRRKKLTRRALIANIKSLGPSMLYILIWAVISFIITFIVLRLPGQSDVAPEAVALGAMVAAGLIVYIFAKLWRRRRRAKSGDGIPGK